MTFSVFQTIASNTLKGVALKALAQNSAGCDDIGEIVFGGNADVTGGIGCLATAKSGMTAGTATSSGASVTLTAVTGYVAPGDVVTDGTNSATILAFVSGTNGGAGVYTLVGAPTPGAWVAASVTSTSTTIDVTAVTAGDGPIVSGAGATFSGSGVTAGYVVSQISGIPGGVGLYQSSVAEQFASTAVTFLGNVLNVATVVSGVLGGGNTFSSGATGSIVAQLTGVAGGVGTYSVSAYQYVAAATTIDTASATAIVDGDNFALFPGTWTGRPHYESNTDVSVYNGRKFWLKLLGSSSLTVGDSSLNNTVAGVVRSVTITAHGFSTGNVFAVGTENFLVLTVDDVNHVDVLRGYAGSTVASHVSTAAILTLANYTGINLLYDIIIPITALAIATAGPEIATAMVALDGFNPKYNGSVGTGILLTQGAKKFNLDWEYISATTRLFFHRPSISGAVGPGTPPVAASSTTVTVGSAITNGAASPAMYGGVQVGEVARSIVSRVPTATEVVLGYMDFAFPYPIKGWQVRGFVTSSGASAVEGATISLSADFRRLTLTNNGTNNFATTQTVVVDVNF